jgi:uncharacterized protein (DUF433 family)
MARRQTPWRRQAKWLPSGAGVRQTGRVAAATVPLISVDSAVCHGQPCVAGTRVMVSVVLDCLASGMSLDELLREYPALTADGVRAAIAYGAELARREGLGFAVE